jgi:dimethylhistidine N-methyltransferase
VPPPLTTLEPPQIAAPHAVAAEARRGLISAPKSLAPWLFYDEAGSHLFEQITALPEYYLTRTERDLFTAHAAEIFHLVSSSTPNLQPAGCPTSGFSDVGSTPLTIVELGAGTASKTGILLRALTRLQPGSPASGPGSLGWTPRVLYQPIDISPTALEQARASIERSIPGVSVRPRVANYITDTVRIERPPGARILALYIGSSIGNFSPAEARAILTRLRSELEPGDALLLGTDLAPSPGANGHGKSIATLLAAYNDAAGVTAAFNRNILARLNRELGANFNLARFTHRAIWNAVHSRIEMHLESTAAQTVHIPANSAGANASSGEHGPLAPALNLQFAPGETIHTENSYKFTGPAIDALLTGSRFSAIRTFRDPHHLFAVTLATAV